ncbi:sigma-54 interaction domain-containing protein [Pendulispora albinea]|uniref:Sigma-54 dependent transcriptional regulator n=1 Tax=Pendulispora albinea TaxID=2741071 RepID=A0ABZ2MC53_9BACT
MSEDSRYDWGGSRGARRGHVGLISRSADLLERVESVAAQCGTVVNVASDVASARELLIAPDYAVKIVDRVSLGLLPGAACAGCAVLDTVFREATISLLVGPRAGDDAGTIQRYAPTELEPLVHEVRSILLRNEGAKTLELEIVGTSASIRAVREQIELVAPYREISVMLLGETGTGKELVAQAIHRLGAPPGAPFVAINCAAVPESLFESELFGHEAGAYTGARGARVGLLEAAGQGVVFLDEVGDMPLALQSKLLRVLETRTFRRVGGTRDLPLQARVVSATNADLELVLRPDLLYRLAGFTIPLPTLRERGDDIALLACVFLKRFSERHRLSVKRFSEAALARLRAHPWPGNVRELRGAVEHAAILSTGPYLEDAHVALAIAPFLRRERLPPAAGSGAYPAAYPAVVASVAARLGESSLERPRLRDLERDMILRAYEDANHKLSGAARSLGIPRSTLRDKLRRFGVLT